MHVGRNGGMEGRLFTRMAFVLSFARPFNLQCGARHWFLTSTFTHPLSVPIVGVLYAQLGQSLTVWCTGLHHLRQA